MIMWTQQEIEFLIANYPERGKNWCAENLNKSEASIRQKASRLGLKQNRQSEFFLNWQSRAKESKIGKKRPEQSLVMKKNHTEGKFVFTDERKKRISERTKKYIVENGHPKGSLGLKHTKETKEIISKNSKKMWANMSENMRDEFSKRSSINGTKNASLNRSGKTTWKGAWRNIGGIDKYYRSSWEANYARYLEWLKQNKQIKDWKHEPKTFWFEGIKRGTVSYLPDFWVINLDDSEEFHEVKGWMDDRSKTKLTRMAKYYPNVKVVLIDAKSYRSLKKDVQHFIKDWE